MDAAERALERLSRKLGNPLDRRDVDIVAGLYGYHTQAVQTLAAELAAVRVRADKAEAKQAELGERFVNQMVAGAKIIAENEALRIRADKYAPCLRCESPTCPWCQIDAQRVRADQFEARVLALRELCGISPLSSIEGVNCAAEAQRVRADTAEAEVKIAAEAWDAMAAEVVGLRGVLQQVRELVESAPPSSPAGVLAGDVLDLLSVSGALNSSAVPAGSANPKQEAGEPVKLSGVNLTFSEEALGDRP